MRALIRNRMTVFLGILIVVTAACTATSPGIPVTGNRTADTHHRKPTGGYQLEVDQLWAAKCADTGDCRPEKQPYGSMRMEVPAGRAAATVLVRSTAPRQRPSAVHLATHFNADRLHPARCDAAGATVFQRTSGCGKV